MTIRFTKGRNKPDTLTCLRDDGSSTWSPSAVGTLHDLIHYTVETSLGYENAFYGLVAQGRDIADFGTKDGRKDVYPIEALWAETIVGFLQAELRSGVRFGAAAYEEMRSRQFPDLPPPNRLTDAVFDQLREAVNANVSRWREVPLGGTLDLAFPA